MFGTIRQAARRTDSPATEFRMRRWLAEGRLPGYYAGNRFMVDMEALDEMVREESLANAKGKTERERGDSTACQG